MTERLEDLLGRTDKAILNLLEMASNARSSKESERLYNKAKGAGLVRSYIQDEINFTRGLR